jgi:hypothetical protein
MQNTPTHRMQMSEPVRAVTSYTEIPVAPAVQEKAVKKTVEPKKQEEDSPL